MITLYLARHGETKENRAQILQGHIPGCLTREGIRQAEVLREQLRETAFDAIVCSDLQRAMDTAQIVAEPHGLTPIPHFLLRERDWGSLTGITIAEAKGKDFPKDTESVEAMFARAERFIRYLHEHHENQTVLAIGHGLFNRVIIASLHRLTLRDVPRMANAEVRIEQITKEICANLPEQQDTEADN